MNPRLPILIRQKYVLVHVPGERRCTRWREICLKEIANGVPPESAGLAAAQAVFPYEARGRVSPDGLPVVEILAAWDEISSDG